MEKQKKLGKLFLPSLTLVLLVLAIGFYLPTLVTEQLTKAISVNLYSSGNLVVKHSTSPAFLLFSGRINNLSVEGTNLETHHINVSKILLQVDKLRVSMWDLLAYGRLNVVDSQGRAALTISEAELDKYLHRFYIDDQYHTIKLELKDDGPRISGTYNSRDFYLDCVFTVEQNSILALSPKKMVSTNPDTQSIMGKLAQMSSYSIELETLGIPLVIDELSVKDNYLYVFASVSN
ncbi:MAG: hypothetical protein PHD88_07385 [Firmicutes bacterium]|nr:hypothetical protein [Bacillota bacterium]MDD4263124.1 hypothetical protein [Bacillota bacterium]MDD4694203.1 hypothetical protein [Bacillota bacterium]